MIARTWRGAVRAKDGDEYLAYLHKTGLSEYTATPGNLGVLTLRRTRGDTTEFLLITLWESEKAIERFAGKDIGRAVYYPEDERYLVEHDDTVDHYEVVYQASQGA